MTGWLVYRMDGRKVKIMGLYKTKETAEKDVDLMGDADWEIEEVHFIGWGIPGSLS